MQFIPKNEQELLTAAMELWKRLMDRTGDPYIKFAGLPTVCFFCAAHKSEGHSANCIWPIAVELVKLDNKGF